MAKKQKTVETIKHDSADRTNIPTAEYQSIMADDEKNPVRVAYERRNRDLDPQLVWRGKDEQDWSDLVVQAPPLYIQEKVHPKALIDDLTRLSQERAEEKQGAQIDLFADFNGLDDPAKATEFYQHAANWTNRMILGDSLQVMASLAEREGLRGKVQCIYIDPPYGIKFNSNFQWSTTSRTVTDGKMDHITREPEQVKAFRDTWRDGIHSYLTYLRDRLTVCRDLLSNSGSIFVQIGDENVHRIRVLMDEVFGERNFISTICFRKKTMPLGASYLEEMFDSILWYTRDISATKYRKLFVKKDYSKDFHWNNYEDFKGSRYKITKKQIEGGFKIPENARRYRLVSLWPASYDSNAVYSVNFRGKKWLPPRGQCYPTTIDKIERLIKANHIEIEGKYLRKILYEEGSNYGKLTSNWDDTIGARDKSYVVETSTFVVQRCILMATDPGDLVIDPTCGSGTTAYVAEQWGRRWITIDTSRVALALARARIMGARYPYYILSDSLEGRKKEAEITQKPASTAPTRGDIRHGFVYERVPHITLKSIANNTEIDVIWEKYQKILDPMREKLNQALGESWEEWEIPRDLDEYLKKRPKSKKSGDIESAAKIHDDYWKTRIRRQKEIDASIAAKADFEYLYDKPHEDKSTVRVAGPFTVESLSPHRVIAVDENDELVNQGARREEEADFAEVVIEHLKTNGVQQAHKEDKINFSSITGWPGRLICAEGLYSEGENEKERRAGIFIGPEFGTVSRPDLVAAAREAGDAGFDVLIACAFSYDAHSADFNKLGKIPVLKARMNADLHMADELKNTGAGNLFVIFGEPDIDILDADNGRISVKINGVDVFHPGSGEVRSSGPEGIACWFIDTDYNEESFFVRHAYFLGASDPYKSLKTTLKAEIDREAWETLHSDVSRPFDKPKSGRIAVKVINHLGDEVMKIFAVK